MPPILPATNEKCLNAHHAIFVRQRKDVSITYTGCIDCLRTLNKGQRFKAVTHHRRAFKIQRLCSRLHLFGQLGLNGGGFATKESFGVGNQLRIARPVDPIDTGRRAAFNLIQQAGPVTIVEETVAATAQQKQLFQCVQRDIDRTGTCKGAIIFPLIPPRAAMLLDARIIMVSAQQDEGEAFVVAQQHVVGGAIPLDQLRLQQERLRLAVSGHDRHAAGQRYHPPQPVGQSVHLCIIGHAVFERPGFADIEHIAARIMHPVHAGFGWQRFPNIADHRDAALQIRLVRTAHSISLRLFIETRGAIGLIRAVGF